MKKKVHNLYSQSLDKYAKKQLFLINDYHQRCGRRKKNYVAFVNNKYRHGSGQMLIVAGVVIAVSVMVLAALSTSLSNIHVSVFTGRSHSLLSEFRDVRMKLGDALKNSNNRIAGMYEFDEDKILEKFSAIESNFSKIELYHGNYLSATIEDRDIDIVYVGTKIYSVNVSLVMRQSDSMISEKIKYLV